MDYSKKSKLLLHRHLAGWLWDLRDRVPWCCEVGARSPGCRWQIAGVRLGAVCGWLGSSSAAQYGPVAVCRDRDRSTLVAPTLVFLALVQLRCQGLVPLRLGRVYG